MNMPLPSDEALYDPEPAQTLLDKHLNALCPRRSSFGLANLVINRDVFDPTLTNVSPLLLEAVKFTRGEHVLDAFSGSGAFSVNAALHGSTAVAIDIASEAIDCGLANAKLNEVGDKIEFRRGEIAACLRDNELFDLIVANPPLLPGQPDGALSAALFDPGLQATTDFIDTLASHLARNGRCFLLTSDVIDRLGHDIDRLCRTKGLEASVVAKADLGYETYRVHKICFGTIL
jgi:methylase of polypeptide subunit release factors